MTFLIIHGIGGYSGIHWQRWLKTQLEDQGHTVLMPAMPEPDHPSRSSWLKTIRESVRYEPTENLIIIGHSLGVTTALDFIEQINTSIHGLVSVSGFATDYGAELNSYFLKIRQIDFAKVRQNIGCALVLYGNDDPFVTQAALKEVADELNVTAYVIENGGHLNTDSGFTEFPLLLDAINSVILPKP